MLLLLLLLVAGAHCTHFELEGHLTDISVEDVARAPARRSHFAPAEAKLKSRMETLFKDKMTEFFVEKFEIHGRGIHPSAMFKAFMTVSLSRSEVMVEIKDHEHLTFFRLMELGALPLPTKEEDGTQPTCINGGFLLPNNTCVCPNFFTGPVCENIICMNQGIADVTGPSCVCPPGFYSTNCEHRGCIPQVTDDINSGGQSFILVLNQKESMAYVLNNLVASLKDILGNDNAIYNNYILVNYVQTDKALYMQSTLFYDIQSLINYMNSILFTKQGKDRQPNNMAAYQAQDFDAFMYPFSNVFVFIDSLDSDTSNSRYELSSDSSAHQLILKTVAWRNRITYMISQPKGSPLQTFDPGYDVYRRVSQAALGDIVSYDIQEWKQALYLMSYYNQNENVVVHYNFALEEDVNVTVSQTKNEKLYALLTVDSIGLIPSITNDKGNLTVLQTGERFTLVSTSVADTQFFTIGVGNAWNFRVFTHSTATMLLGYDYNSKTDVGSVYTPHDYNTVLSGAVRFTTSSKTTVQWIDTMDGTSLAEPMVATLRPEACSYPLTMGVPQGSRLLGPFGHKVIMEVSGGSIARIVPGYAVSMDDQSPAPFLCFNGGTKVQGAKKCNCAPLFEGPNCGIPMCRNGGSVNNFPGNGFGLCNCPTGYSGDHCTILNCTRTHGAYPSPGSSLSLVVQNTLSQAHIGKNISSGINNLISAMKDTHFTDYQLTTFRMEGTQNDIIYTQTSKIEFENDVKSINYLPSQSTTQDSLAAIVIAVQNVNYQNSPMFVFVDSPQSVNTSEQNILALVVAKGIQLNMIITAPYGLPELCMNDSSTGIYQELARKTGGIYVNLCKPYNHHLYPADSIAMIFSGYAVSHHGTESVNENFFTIFNEGTRVGFEFYIDQPENDAFFIVNCPNSEIFNATLANSDLNTAVPLSTAVSVPFLAVYKLPLLVSSSAYYKVEVYGVVPSCFLKVVTKSTEALFLSFTKDPSQDVTSQFLGYATNTHPVVHLATDRLNLSQHVGITAYSELSGSGFSYSGYGTLRESTCSYEFFFESPLACNYPSNSYVFRVSATTNTGKTYMRAVRGFCFLAPNSCLNGGQFLSLPTPHCDCPAEYQGFYCEEPICSHGTPSDYFSCDCDYSGFTGAFCSRAKCRNWNYLESVDPRSSDMKQITFVLNRNVQNLLVNTQLSSILWSIILSTVGYETQTLYSLVMFDSKGVQTVESTSNVNKFLQSFQTAVGQNLDMDTTSKTKSIDAINEALKLNIAPPGIILVFTPNEPATFSPALIDNFLQQRLDTEVNVFYTPPQVAYPTLPPSSNTTDLLYQTVKQSGGRFLPLTQNSISTMAYMVSSAFNLNGFVFDDAFQDCSTSNVFLFELESGFQFVEITITGFDVSAKGRVLVFSEQIQMEITDDNIVFQDNSVLVLVFYNDNFDTFARPGSWGVRVQTTAGSCSCQARVNSNTQVIPGFTSDMFSDFVYSLPYTGTGENRQTYMTYRVTNRDSELAPYLQEQHVFKTNYVTPYSERTPLNVLDLSERDSASCAYQFTTGSWTVDQYPYQKILLIGSDSRNSVWQRTFFFTFPTAADANSTCINGHHDLYGQCKCTDSTKWKGDYCETPICQNRGISSYGICICDNGFYGDFCENLVTKKLG